MSLINELCKFNKMYGSGGSSEVKLSMGTEDGVEDSPDKDKEAADFDPYGVAAKEMAVNDNEEV